MEAHATAAGLRRVAIVNTCAVTAEAVRQSEQRVRRLRREYPDARLIVTGCAAQIEPDRFAALPGVDHVLGNAEKSLPATFQAIAAGQGATRVMVGDIMSASHAAGPPVDAPLHIPRAFVQVQNGCDHRCTFCVIPFGRGRSRSVQAHDVVERIRSHVARGVPEIVLTGVDITSWGNDLPRRPTLGMLVREILRDVPALARLRLSSIDQAETDEALLEAFADEPRVMPHLHLSLQSGNDLILKRMKRRHSRADAVEFCARVRRLRPDMALGADLIAGFPTETEQHFRDTLSIVEECGLSFLHVFPYSPRRDTPAARMPQVAAQVVNERAAILREKGRAVLDSWLKGHKGRIIEVALEKGGDGDLPARTPQFAQAKVSGVSVGTRAGESIAVHVTGQSGGRLLAEVRR